MSGNSFGEAMDCAADRQLRFQAYLPSDAHEGWQIEPCYKLYSDSSFQVNRRTDWMAGAS